MESYKAYYIAEELPDGSAGRPIGLSQSNIQDEALSLFTDKGDAEQVLVKMKGMPRRQPMGPLAIFIVNVTPAGKLVTCD